MSIRTSRLSYGYDPKVLVLENVCFSAKDGEVTSIIGPNGVGKTTLLKCILGLREGWSGEIFVNDREVRSLTRRQSSALLAYVPQFCYPTFNYPCLDMVVMGANNRIGPLGNPDTKDKEEALACMDRLGVSRLKDRLFLEVSGGERQLVLIARSLMQRAKTLLLDEPVANLDLGNQFTVLDEVSKLAGEGYCVVMTTHNPEQAYQYSSCIAAFKDSRLLLEGNPKDVVTEEMIKTLYGVDVHLESLVDDAFRICLPSHGFGGKE